MFLQASASQKCRSGGPSWPVIILPGQTLWLQWGALYAEIGCPSEPAPPRLAAAQHPSALCQANEVRALGAEPCQDGCQPLTSCQPSEAVWHYRSRRGWKLENRECLHGSAIIIIFIVIYQHLHIWSSHAVAYAEAAPATGVWPHSWDCGPGAALQRQGNLQSGVETY